MPLSKCLVIACLFLALHISQAADTFEKIGANYVSKVLPLLESHCLNCHDAETQKGDLDLERFAELSDVRKDPAVWQKVVEQLELGEMPPKDKKQLSEKQYDELLAWSISYLDGEALARAGDPGPVVLRRLSNAEYTYTIRDLTGVVDLDPAAEFPVDSAAGEGFTNTGNALVISPALLEKYLAAGKGIASHAVLLPDGFRFSRSNTRRDWSNEILDEIRALYAAKLHSGGVDFSYRSEVGEVESGDGRLDYRNYFEALIQGERTDDLNPKYYGILESMLGRERAGGSILLDELRRQFREAKPGEGAKLAAWVRGWQDQLWKFNSVGARGLIRPWQEPLNPVNTRADFRVKLVPPANGGDLTLTLLATSDDVVWENPQIIRPGHPPLSLLKVKAAAEAMLKSRPDISKLLGTAFTLKGKMDAETDDPALRSLLVYLGITTDNRIQDYLTQRVENLVGQAAFQGWAMPDVADISVLGNGTDATHRIPGEVPPHRVVMHPRPERWVAATWLSPFAGEVKIEAHVQDRHDACGNGAAWSVLHQGRTLSAGEIDNGGTAVIDPIEKISIKKGEIISLRISARGTDHTCDLTETELKISAAEETWSLTEDCADKMGQGNPNGVWHFHTGLAEENESTPAVPAGSLLANWLQCEDEAKAAALASQIREFVQRPSVEGLSASDAEIFRQLRKVLSQYDFSQFADGTDENLTAGEATFTIPAALLGEAELTVSGRVLKGSAQFRILQGQVDSTAKWAPGAPVTEAEAGESEVAKAFDDFREIFPSAMCYARIVPIDEVVTLVLYHREDDQLARLMLTDSEARHLDRLWDELRYVSQDAFQMVTGLEQILEFATQDGDPKSLDPLREPIATAAANLEKRLQETEPIHLEKVIELAPLAYRRPLEENEAEELRNLYKNLRGEKLSHDESVRLGLAKIFTSPEFLYKSEAPPAGDGQGPVSDWELATRLSYFLSSSAPDAELRRAVAEGEFDAGEQAQRLLKDPRVRRMAIEFGCQWLHIRDFDSFDEKSESTFPEFVSMRSEMYEESVRFFTDLFQNDGSILSLLNADYAFVNADLAKFYGLNHTGDWSRVASNRGGVLGMAATLARQSGASRTSPILRGNWVSETLLGEKLPRPPKGVPPLPESVPEGLSERAMIERHASDAACSKCHARIDPYGFALEQFDAIGRFREVGSDGKPVDTKTTLIDETEIEGMAALRDYLVNTRRDAVVRQFCRKLLGYALGREILLSDKPLLDEMNSKLKVNDYRFSIAVDCIVQSKQFREIRSLNFESK